MLGNLSRPICRRTEQGQLRGRQIDVAIVQRRKRIVPRAGACYVCFDFNGDSHIPDTASPQKTIEPDVLVWHAGKDDDPQTWADNHWAWLTER